MKELPSERRQYLRVEDALTVNVRLAASGDAPRYASSLDMSGGGIRLESDASVKKGSWVWLEFELPGDDDVIECLAEVRWVRDAEGGGGRFSYGVNFFDIEETDRRRLIKYLFAKHYGYEREEGVAVSVRELRKSFHDMEVLKGVTFEADRGEVLALIGLDGAGKTTLLRILATLLKPDSGSVELLGLDAVAKPKEVRTKIGYMPQVTELSEDRTVLQNLKNYAHDHGLRGDELNDLVREALVLTKLTERANDKVRYLSGGMRQRLLLSCAIVHRPKVILLDDPSAGIDLAMRRNLWDHFRQLAELGITVIVATQQLDEVEYCDRAILLHEGVIALDDTPENIRKSVSAGIVLNVRGRHIEHNVRNYRDALPGLIRELGDDLIRLDSIHIRESSIEDIILDRIAGGEKE